MGSSTFCDFDSELEKTAFGAPLLRTRKFAKITNDDHVGYPRRVFLLRMPTNRFQHVYRGTSRAADPVQCCLS